MKARRTRSMVFAFTVAALMPLAGSASAQAWPNKPLTIVSPYPAGGITDQLCRIVGDELGRSLGQPVVVENRLGAGGAIAMSTVAKAAPDGYTLVMGGSAVSTIMPALNPNVTYHPLKDFEPISYVAALPIVMVVHPSLPASDVRQFVAYAKANADKLNCAHHGAGTGTHLACVQFARMIGATIADIGYKGAPQVNADLLANRVQLYFGTLPTQIGYIRAGQLRAYGIASDRRVETAPELPTLAEQGLPGLNLDSWNALYVPAGTPPAIVERLNAEVVRILGLVEVRNKILATGSVPRATSVAELRKLTTEEFESFRKLGATANIRLE